MIDKKLLLNPSNKPGVISDDGSAYTYQDLIDSVDRIADYLKKRSLVFCLARNTIGSLAGYLSFITNGVVPVMIESSWDYEYLHKYLNIYKPEYIWLPSETLLGLKNAEIIIHEFDYSLYKLEWDFVYPLHNDLALLLTTSGSTGSPKLVRLTYENIISNATSIAEYLSIDEHERPITTLPMHYSFGLSIINSHLISGATLLLTDRSIVEKEFWSFFNNSRATSLSGIPYTFEILKKLRFMGMNTPHLKTITQAGGKLNDELNLEFSKFCRESGKKFYVMYGQTEATARMSYLPPEYSVEKVGSMGIAIPYGEFYLVDDEGNKIESDETVGELVYKGQNVSMGYASCGEDLSAGDENRRILVTGDFAKRDSDSFYYIVGRKKRFIKLFGNRVNLDETERLIKNITPDVACAGVDDNMVIYIADPNLLDTVRSFISEKTGINSRAFEVRAIERIPKNSSGKTVYSQLNN